MQIARRSSILNTVLLAFVVGGGVALAGWQTGTNGALLGLIPAALILGLGLRRAVRRWHLARTPLPDRNRTWLSTHVPLYRTLDDSARARFERDVQFVLDEYSFEGVKDVTVTDTLRLSVAAGVATLLHGRPSWELPGSNAVLFYPDRFNDTYHESTDGAFDGMAHQQGPIILTAPAVANSWAGAHDANNVVLHELAHLFDFDNEGADGVPSLVAILRPYAAEAPSEFFAVSVETFFEQPDRMARHHDELFRALVSFFHLDPRTGTRTGHPEKGTGKKGASDVD
ncbi:MAG: hypothetical protein BRD35_07620 [Bacteroidetes bacterium QH_7_62_13]|nr:MAG: hypothetical protein BRD35_07620 [Bacteroidetes bacterium QH_7_62_13]